MVACLSSKLILKHCFRAIELFNISLRLLSVADYRLRLTLACEKCLKLGFIGVKTFGVDDWFRLGCLFLLLFFLIVIAALDFLLAALNGRKQFVAHHGYN